MALISALTFTSVTADGEQSTLTDSTVYGGANPVRAAVAIYLTAYKVDSSNVETALAVTTFDPELATAFTVANGVDGRHRYKFVIVNYWSNAGGAPVYSKYDLVWSSTLNLFYEYINNTPSAGGAANPVVTDTNYWTTVADPTTKIANVGTASNPANLIYQILEKIIDFDTAKCYADISILTAKESCEAGCDCSSCTSRTGKAKVRIRTLLSLMRIADTRQLYLQGEIWAREAEKYCIDCGCLEL